MFRQVVMFTWAEGVSPEAKAAMCDAIDAMRAIPELLAMEHGDDAGHFPDNYDHVMVADFASFESARRYVAHPLHQTYVTEFASKLMDKRVVVQHDWDPAGTTSP